MKYCSYCGHQLFDESVVCTNCGCAVSNFGSNANQNCQANQQSVNTDKPKKVNPLCLAGFIMSFIIPLVGLILSCVGRSQLNENPNQEGESYAKAGIIISAVYLGLSVVASIGSIIFMFVIAGIIAL